MTSTHALTDRLLGDRYRIGGVLGRGGMAEVYDGFDERLDRPVAIKVLRPEMAARADVRARFEAEARAAARLVHPNVVGVFDSGEDGPDGSIPYLVMERLPGETMADRMRAADSPDTGWVLRVAGDVLLALGAAHAAGIVHRDVKPGNVLLASDGCAKVADFGIAKSLEVAAAADLTSTNQLLGTPAYVAPERIEGLPATVRSDLYAVGVLLYEALAGVKPFSGDTPVSTAYAIRHETPVALSSLRPDLPSSVVAAVERAMAREPEERFGSAAELAAALGVAASGPAVRPVIDESADPTTVLPVTTVVAAGAGAGTDPTTDAARPAAGGADATTLARAAVPFGTVEAPAARGADPTIDGGGGEAVPARRAAGAAMADGVRRVWHDDRRRLLLLAVAGGVVALVLLGLAVAGAGEKHVSPARKALAGDLHDSADGLGTKDGKSAGAAADALDDLGNKVSDGGGAGEATKLLGQLVAWRDSGALTTATADRLATLVRRVPGANPAAYAAPTTTTAAPPPTEPPPPAPGPRGKKKHGHEGD